MMLVCSTLGVEPRPILPPRASQVCRRLRTRAIGSPSPPADKGYRSTSSQKAYLAGQEDRPVELLAPTILSVPPANLLCRIVLEPSRDLLAATLARKAGVTRIFGSNRSLDQIAPSSWVGIATRMRDGSLSTRQPRRPVNPAVQPIWAALTTGIISTVSSPKESKISRRN